MTRLQLQDLENGELILLDVSARDGKAALEPVRLVYSGEVATASASHKGAVSGRDASGERENGAAGQGEVKLSAPLPVQLTRYAARHLYARCARWRPCPVFLLSPLSLPSSPLCCPRNLSKPKRSPHGPRADTAWSPSG